MMHAWLATEKICPRLWGLSENMLALKGMQVKEYVDCIIFNRNIARIGTQNYDEGSDFFDWCEWGHEEDDDTWWNHDRWQHFIGRHRNTAYFSMQCNGAYLHRRAREASVKHGASRLYLMWRLNDALTRDGMGERREPEYETSMPLQEGDVTINIHRPRREGTDAHSSWNEFSHRFNENLYIQRRVWGSIIIEQNIEKCGEWMHILSEDNREIWHALIRARRISWPAANSDIKQLALNRERYDSH